MCTVSLTGSQRVPWKLLVLYKAVGPARPAGARHRRAAPLPARPLSRLERVSCRAWAALATATLRSLCNASIPDAVGGCAVSQYLPLEFRVRDSLEPDTTWRYLQSFVHFHF